MSKIIYANMGVKSSVRTSTIQPAAPKLSKVHFDILNLKNKKMVRFPLYFLEFPFYLQRVLGLMKMITKSNETLGICDIYIW